MGTRCTVRVHDQHDDFCIFRHWDGYPEDGGGVIADIQKALQYAWPLPRFEADEFITGLVRAWKDEPGNIRFATGHDQYGDTEWWYDITTKAGKLHITVTSAGDSAPTFEGTLDAALAQFVKQAA